jgi:hypothetical protein
VVRLRFFVYWGRGGRKPLAGWFRAAPLGLRDPIGSLSQDFILGYYRFLPPGGGTLALPEGRASVPLEFLHFLKRRFWDLRVSVVIVESVGLIYN